MNPVMTDEERRALVTAYLAAFDNGGTGHDGVGVLDYFADDARFRFPKWGLAVGRPMIGELFADLGATVHAVTHHFSSFTWIHSGGDVLAVEGTTHGRHRDGRWEAGRPEWGAGHWCGVFEVRDRLIHRASIYLDPDYAGQDVDRYPWLSHR